MNVEAFGYFSTDYPTDLDFDCSICWSRIYEYPFALARSRGAVHNTSWGFRGVHRRFRDRLDAMFADVVHSDRRPGGVVWDITTPPPAEWVGRFDTLLSISTLEEVRADHAAIIRDHFLPQLRPGGRVVVTFDVPGLRLAGVERWLGQEIHVPDVMLTPRSSERPDEFLNLPADFWVGFLVLAVPEPVDAASPLPAGVVEVVDDTV